MRFEGKLSRSLMKIIFKSFLRNLKLESLMWRNLKRTQNNMRLGPPNATLKLLLQISKIDNWAL